MKTKDIIGKAIEIVGILITAFGGILLKIQPPGIFNKMFSNFIGSFASLIILLLIWAVVRKVNNIYKWWIGLAAASLFTFIITALGYQRLWDHNVVIYPKESTNIYVVGDSLTDYGKKIDSISKQRNLLTDKFHLIQNGGGSPKISAIWSDINAVGERMVIHYIIIMMALACAIFGITEGILTTRTANKALRKKKKKAKPVEGKP